MELVYLWVDKYKNIKEQGFNFSTEYICTYVNNILSITNNEDYIENFFHEVGITTIFTLVGKNGAGKSSVFECMSAVISNKSELITFDFFAVFKSKNCLTVYVNNFELSEFYFNNESHSTIDYNKYESQYCIYYSNMFNTGIFNQTIDNFASPRFKTFDKRDKRDKFLNQSILNFYINANRIIEDYESNSIYMNLHGLRINQLNQIYQNANIFVELHFLKRFGNEILPFKVPEILNLSIAHNRNTYNLGRYNKVLEKIEQAIFEHKRLKQHDIGNFEDLSDEVLSADENKLLVILNSCINSEDTFELQYHQAEEFILLYQKIGIELFDFKWKSMSGGEESIFQLLSLLLPAIEASIDKVEKKSVVHICLDEVENNLHPKWQRKLVTFLLSFFNVIQRTRYNEYKQVVYIHLHIATHSPFLLSDIPKSNIIFLDKDENGQCTVVKGIRDKKETFGANIHTLLSDGFFMDDGLIGAFAKEKINIIILNLNDEEYEPEDDEKINVLQTIKLIGEPFLKRKLLDMYYKKFDDEYSKSTRKKELELEQARIAEELKKYD